MNEVRNKLKNLKNLFEEAKEHLKNGNVVQGCEKLYKITEDCIKLLAEHFNLEEFKEAKEEGAWWSKLLARASLSLSQKLNEMKIHSAWLEAFDLHRHGFHEEIYTKEDVENKKAFPLIEWLLNYTEEILKNK